MFLVFYLLLFILGLCFGSFLGAYVIRVGREESVAKGRSKCDYCGHPLRWSDNIPLLSWVFLLAKCRYCRHHLGLFYPTIELVTAATFVTVGILLVDNLSHVGNIVHLVLGLIIACTLIVIFFADYLYGLIPNVAIYIGVFATLLLKVWIAGFGIWEFRSSLTTNVLGQHLLQTDYFRNHVNQDFIWTFVASILAAVVVYLFFWFLVKATNEKGMGRGDIGLGLLAALICGWPLSPVAIFISFVSGAAISVGLITLGRKTMKSTIHFGPFLVLSIPTTLLFGDVLLRMYLGI